jgi:hypothetical protein
VSWRTVGAREAARHPRYGVGGWLYLFFGLVVFAVVADAVEWIQYGEGSDRPRWLLGLDLVVYLAILVAGFTKWRWFPELAIAGIWLTGGLGQLFTEHARLGPEEGAAIDPRQVGLVAFVVFSLILSWALWASERVNVTYRHRVWVREG